jgi:hypothetical protein
VRQLDELSTAFANRINMVLNGTEPDADGNPRQLPQQVRDMMYPFGSAENPQLTVRVIPHAAELVRWAQLRGQSMYTWSLLERDALGQYVKRQMTEYVGRIIAFYEIWKHHNNNH